MLLNLINLMKKELIIIKDFEKDQFSKEKKIFSNKYILIKRLKTMIFFMLFLVLISVISNKSYENSYYKTDKIRITYLRRKYGSFLKHLPNYNHSYITNKTIFWCWFKGLNNITKLGLSSLNSIKKNLKDYNLIIINDSNIKDYVNIPKYIMDKYKTGKMTPTHFSDILRLELLNKYGGTWIDASVLITKYEPRFYDNILFFFGSKSDEGCVGSSWFITSEKGSPILKTTLDLLYEYWKKNEKLYNYFLLHLFIKMACDKYKDDYNKVLFISNQAPHILQKNLKNKFNKTLYNIILDNSSVHKLTIHVKNEEFKNDTFYSHIIKEYY